MNKKVMDMVRVRFRPEYLNRLDEIIIFHSLSKENIIGIVKFQVKKLVERVKNSADIDLKVTDAVLNHIADDGYDPAYGARPIKRLIQREIENALASELLTRKLPKEVAVELKDGKIVFV